MGPAAMLGAFPELDAGRVSLLQAALDLRLRGGAALDDSPDAPRTHRNLEPLDEGAQPCERTLPDRMRSDRDGPLSTTGRHAATRRDNESPRAMPDRASLERSRSEGWSVGRASPNISSRGIGDLKPPVGVRSQHHGEPEFSLRDHLSHQEAKRRAMSARPDVQKLAGSRIAEEKDGHLREHYRQSPPGAHSESIVPYKARRCQASPSPKKERGLESAAHHRDQGRDRWLQQQSRNNSSKSWAPRHFRSNASGDVVRSEIPQTRGAPDFERGRRRDRAEINACTPEQQTPRRSREKMRTPEPTDSSRSRARPPSSTLGDLDRHPRGEKRSYPGGGSMFSVMRNAAAALRKPAANESSHRPAPKPVRDYRGAREGQASKQRGMDPWWER